MFKFTGVNCRPLLTFWAQAKLDIVNLFHGVHYGMCATFQSTTSLLSKQFIEINYIKLYDLFPDNSIKKRKQIDHNACLLGEATMSEWLWVHFYRILLSQLQTLVQYE